MTKTFPPVVGMGDATRISKMSSTYIRRMIRKNRLHPQRTSSGFIFLKSEILDYKKEREKKAKSDVRIQL